MTWKKVVKVVGVSECPVCGNPAFDFEPNADIDDPRALVRCGKCGRVCPADQFIKSVQESKGAT
jgi:ferredoxin